MCHFNHTLVLYCEKIVQLHIGSWDYCFNANCLMNRKKLELLSFSNSMCAQEGQNWNNFFSSVERPAYLLLWAGTAVRFSSAFHSPFNLFTLSQEAGKLEDAFYNLTGVTEVSGISQVPTLYTSLPLNRSRDSLSLIIGGILSTDAIFTIYKQSHRQNIILTKISEEQGP